MKKTTYILIDKSGSMHDNDEHTRASSVNESMRQVMCDILPEILAQKDADLDPYIAVLTFSKHVEWIIPRTRMEYAAGIWKNIELSEFMGKTSTGAAIEAVIDDINNATSDDSDDSDPDEIAPAIILISDGQPTDDYEDVLRAADPTDTEHYCAPFRYATRVAIGIQVDAAGEASLRRFGRVSPTLRERGIDGFISCTDVNDQILSAIIKHVTRGATLGA